MVALHSTAQMRFGFAEYLMAERARAQRVLRRARPANDREQLCFWFYEDPPQRKFVARIGVPASRAECPS